MTVAELIQKSADALEASAAAGESQVEIAREWRKLAELGAYVTREGI